MTAGDRRQHVTVDDPVDSETPAGTEPGGRVPGQLWRAVRRDPLHFPSSSS